MRILRFLFLLLLILAGLLALLVLVDWLFLTRTFKPTHTEKTAALPLYNASSPDGLVRIAANGMEFRARLAGMANKDGEGIILLHGFPETSIMWEEAMLPLAEAGYRVVAFDQRGYSPGARPQGVTEYAFPKLVGDIFSVADAVGFRIFHLVGHDWGAGIGWGAAANPRDRILSYTALSVPHTQAFFNAIQNDPDQQKRSSYMLLFRTPYVSEFMLGFNNFALMRSAIYDKMSDRQIQEYLEVLSEKGALTAALNWYRGIPETATVQTMEVNVPTLLIWGDHDPALGRVAVDNTPKYVKGPYKLLVLDAGHWLIQEKTAECVEAIQAQIVANSTKKK